MDNNEFFDRAILASLPTVVKAYLRTNGGVKPIDGQSFGQVMAESAVLQAELLCAERARALARGAV